MSIRIYVPGDSAARSVGADEVALAIRTQAPLRGIEVDVRRNSSRGLFWLEPMVEVWTEHGRIAYGPVDVADVSSLFEAGFTHGGDHQLRLGRPEEIDYLRTQNRYTMGRIGVIEPLSLEDYRANGGFEGLQKAITMSAPAIVEEVLNSGLRGRGGAGFPTGIKWKTVSEAPGSSGARSWTSLRARSTSSAMRTKAIAAPTPTAW
jgi:formate dehydrogenase iron-sulfur subunit